VPIPWEATGATYGFNDATASWLPQPKQWARFARSAEREDPESTLWLYRRLLAERRRHALGAGTLEWLHDFGDDVVAYRNGAVTVIANAGTEAVTLPEGELLLSSEPIVDRVLPQDTTVWLV